MSWSGQTDVVSGAATRWVAALAVLSTLLPWTGAAEPLTLEDVVRLFVSGTPVAELRERVATADVDFDLSDEMLDELRAAGIPADLIEAMVARQEELDAARRKEAGEAPGEEAAQPAELPGLTITVRESPQVRLDEFIPRQQIAALGLRGDSLAFTDIAVAVLCTTDVHVPDHWRSKSPLGRDFRFAPRHRVLFWQAGARREKRGVVGALADATSVAAGEERPDGVLVLDLPEVIRVDLDPREPHRIVLGLAVQADERFYLMASDAIDALVEESGGDDTTGAEAWARFRGRGSVDSFSVWLVPAGAEHEGAEEAAGQDGG
jgi:hypothetical protein